MSSHISQHLGLSPRHWHNSMHGRVCVVSDAFS